MKKCKAELRFQESRILCGTLITIRQYKFYASLVSTVLQELRGGSMRLIWPKRVMAWKLGYEDKSCFGYWGWQGGDRIGENNWGSFF